MMLKFVCTITFVSSEWNMGMPG